MKMYDEPEVRRKLGAFDEVLTALIATTRNLRELERAFRGMDPQFADLIAMNAAGNERTIAKATA